MSVTIVMKNAPTAIIGEFQAKPTSLVGDVREASEDLWSAPANGLVETGIWEATVGIFAATREGFHEICYLISGRATLVDQRGERVDVEAGDLFVTPAGWMGTWEVHEPVRKVFVITHTG
jgi:uncharacterized protein